MPRREVSFVIVPHYEGKTREMRFTVWSLKLGAILAAVLLLGLTVFVVLAARIHIADAEYRALKERNAELELQLGQVDQLRLELAKMKQEDDKIRQMLGFDQEPPRLDLGQLYTALADSSRDSLNPVLPESAPALLRKGSNARLPSMPPLAEYTISRGRSNEHTGVDLVAETGAPVMATADGIVRSVAWDTIYGNSITLQHDRDLRTFYGHLLRVAEVVGDSVQQGHVIGYVGSTGRSTGPHLHYEVLKSGKPQDPTKYFQ